MMAAFALIFGVFCGVIFSFPVAAIVENFGSSHYERLVCELPGLSDSTAVNGSAVNGLDIVSVTVMSP